jgi:hypothetical protein
MLHLMVEVKFSLCSVDWKNSSQAFQSTEGTLLLMEGNMDIRGKGFFRVYKLKLLTCVLFSVDVMSWNRYLKVQNIVFFFSCVHPVVLGTVYCIDLLLSHIN